MDKKEITIFILGAIVAIVSLAKLANLLDSNICESKLEFMKLKGGFTSVGCYVELESGEKVLLANYSKGEN